jgi:translation initiation factor IF-2
MQVNLRLPSLGLIVAFSVSVPRPIQVLASQSGVTIISSSVIYRLMDEIKEKVIGLLPRITEKRITGEATVSQFFEIQMKHRRSLKVAGCRVSNGLLEKSKPVRVVRNGTVVHEGEYAVHLVWDR